MVTGSGTAGEAHRTLWKDNLGAIRCSGYAVVRRLEASDKNTKNTTKIRADLCFGTGSKPSYPPCV